MIEIVGDDYWQVRCIGCLFQDYNDEIRQEQMREMQLLSSPAVAAASAEVLASPPPSASPTLLAAAKGAGGGAAAAAAAAVQNGRMQAGAALVYSQTNGRPSYLYQPQQLLLHPAFRGIAARPATASGTSITSDLYLHLKLNNYDVLDLIILVADVM